MKKQKNIEEINLFNTKIRALKEKFDYKVTASKPIIHKDTKLINYKENDIIIDNFMNSTTIEDRDSYIRQLLANFDSYFKKYICLLKYDYRSVLSKDTLQFISLFQAGRTADISSNSINKICLMLKSIFKSYTDQDLYNEFVLITIKLMERYRKRVSVSFTQYFIKIFRYKLVNLAQHLSIDLANSMAFNNDNILSPTHLESRIKAYHTDYNSDIIMPNDNVVGYSYNDLDINWLLKPRGVWKCLELHERFMLYRRFICKDKTTKLSKVLCKPLVSINNNYNTIKCKLDSNNKL